MKINWIDPDYLDDEDKMVFKAILGPNILQEIPRKPMTGKKFKQILNFCTKRGKLKLELLVALSPELKKELALYLIRYRLPVIKELTIDLDKSWLASMGYLYETKGKLFTFVHNSESKIE